MRPTRLKIENFLSFEFADYSFQDGPVALIGLNKTDDGQGSNGVGKSGLQQAIYFAITGNNLRSSLDKKLIRRDQKNASVELTIQCSFRKEQLFIRRELYTKSTSKLFIKLNNEDVNFATVKDGNNYILDWIGISNEDLKSYFIICKEYYKSFFKTSNTEKLALISRFINFSFLDKAKDIINSSIDKLNNAKRLIENEKFKIEGQIEAFEEQLIKEENRNLDAEKSDQILECEENIEKYEKAIVVHQNTILANKVEISKFTEQIEDSRFHLKELEEKLNKFDIKELELGIEEIKKELENVKKGQNESLQEQELIQKKRDDIRRSLRKIQVNLAGVITCPKCNHKFLTLENTTLELEQAKKIKLDKQDKVYIKEEDSILATLKEYEDVISELICIKNGIEEEYEAVRCQIRKIRTEIDEINSIISLKTSSIKRNEKIIENSKYDTEELIKRISSNKEKIENIKTRKDEINTKPIEEKIESAEIEYQEKEKQLKELEEKIFKKNEWIQRFKNFKMYLASEQIKNIQQKTNDILKKENSDLRLLIEAFKLDSKGNQKEEITPYVLRDEAESFWYYSGGERARVEIALIIAIQQMINLTNPNGGFEFLSIDEITEGLSEEGLYDIIEALSFIDYPILITTHIFNQNTKCKTLKVEKVNGISSIVI